MIGIKIKDGFLDFAITNFNCPNCGMEYNDENNKYLNRCIKNKTGITKINCVCNLSFYMTYNYKGDAVSYLL